MIPVTSWSPSNYTGSSSYVATILVSALYQTYFTLELKTLARNQQRPKAKQGTQLPHLLLSPGEKGALFSNICIVSILSQQQQNAETAKRVSDERHPDDRKPPSHGAPESRRNGQTNQLKGGQAQKAQKSCKSHTFDV